MKMINIISGCVSFLCGNFIYQFFTQIPNYQIACERSYFQLVAMGIVIWLLRGKINWK